MKDRLVFLGAGLVIVALLVAGFLYATRGSHIRLEGRIQKVRTLAADEKASRVDQVTRRGSKLELMLKASS